MKFSEKKKAKIRKRNQKRIKRCCGNMIGCSIYVEDDSCYEVIDQTKIKDIIYLLTLSENGEYSIFKIVKVFCYVRLSAKKILQNYQKFSNPDNWIDKSILVIDNNGKIQSAKRKRKKYEFDGTRYVAITIYGDIY